MNGIRRFFKYDERGATLSGDIIGGIVTFLAMCYILPVNAAILSDAGMDAMGVFASTAICSALITVMMGLVANAPVALSAGMGLNAYLTYTVCLSLGYKWQEAMILLTVTGLLFFIFSLTPVRRKIIEAFPKNLRQIISAGLGAFIAFVGLKGAGIIVKNDSTLVALGSLSDPTVILSIVGIFAVFALMHIATKKGLLASLAVPLAMLATALVGFAIWGITKGAADSTLPHADFTTHWGINNIENVFMYGLWNSNGDPTVKTGSEFWGVVGSVFSKPASYAVIFSMIFVNMFDTTATIMTVGRDTGIVDENGMITSNRAILADATGALICAPLGTSTVTSFAESTIGVKVGARTGVAAIVTGLLFLLSAFIYPVFELFTYSSVSCAALVAVGGIIFAGNLREIKWNDPAIAFSAFITVLLIVLTYSLTNGIGFGLLTYLVIMIATKRAKEVSWILYMVGVFYLANFAINEVVANM